MMAGLYLHIPFCRQACHYCDFHFSTTLNRKGDFVDAICRELAMRSREAENKIQSTVYFGGGTPSLLDDKELSQIFETIHLHYPIAADAEITLEANPDDVTAINLARWKKEGVNRLSIGIQSFFDSDLQFMNRAHNAGEALRCVKLAQDAGFENITIDLIYGSPTTTHAMWEENLETAISLNVPHISAYCLTVEDQTALAHFVKKGKAQPVDDQHSSAQYLLLVEKLAAAGIMQYEISNFAKAGMQSKHNSSYWKGETYIGLGPSAHSFDGNNRRWNISNNARYIAALGNQSQFWELEALSENDRFNEYIMIRLRTSEGIDLRIVREKSGEEKLQHLLTESASWLHSGELIRHENMLLLSAQGKLLADRIASDLFAT